MRISKIYPVIWISLFNAFYAFSLRKNCVHCFVQLLSLICHWKVVLFEYNLFLLFLNSRMWIKYSVNLCKFYRSTLILQLTSHVIFIHHRALYRSILFIIVKKHFRSKQLIIVEWISSSVNSLNIRRKLKNLKNMLSEITRLITHKLLILKVTM